MFGILSSYPGSESLARGLHSCGREEERECRCAALGCASVGSAVAAVVCRELGCVPIVAPRRQVRSAAFCDAPVRADRAGDMTSATARRSCLSERPHSRRSPSVVAREPHSLLAQVHAEINLPSWASPAEIDASRRGSGRGLLGNRGSRGAMKMRAAERCAHGLTSS